MKILNRHGHGRGGASAVVSALVTCTLLVLAACGSGSGSDTDVRPSATAPGSAPAASSADAADPSRPVLPPPTADEPDSEAVNAALVGMTEAQATAAATAAGYTVRIASVDGEPRALTMDYRFDRINLQLESGTVTGATVG